MSYNIKGYIKQGLEVSRENALDFVIDFLKEEYLRQYDGELFEIKDGKRVVTYLDGHGNSLREDIFPASLEEVAADYLVKDLIKTLREEYMPF